jgi:hypothetical protein
MPRQYWFQNQRRRSDLVPGTASHQAWDRKDVKCGKGKTQNSRGNSEKMAAGREAAAAAGAEDPEHDQEFMFYSDESDAQDGAEDELLEGELREGHDGRGGVLPGEHCNLSGQHVAVSVAPASQQQQQQQQRD